MQRIGDLKVGDAFWYEGEAYIAIALTPDPFDVYCLNVRTRELEELEEAEQVEVINDWALKIISPITNIPARGKNLEVLY